MAAPSRDATCPHCELTYGELRTGQTFGGVKEMMWVASDDSSRWRYRRRHAVLGMWMSLKRDLWSQHLGECAFEAKTLAEVEDAEAGCCPDDEIPWEDG